MRAFTLVEMTIVTAIIIIFISVATPKVLRSLVNAYEGMAITNIKTITKACGLYNIDKEDYPQSLSELTTPQSDPPYIGTDLASGHKQSYDFEYSVKTEGGFELRANPTAFLKTANAKYFYTDESEIIHFKYGGPAGPDDEIYR